MSYKSDIFVEQGATFVVDIECQDEDGSPIDITGCIASAHIRNRYSDPSPAAVFIATIDGPNGIINLELTPEQSSAMTSFFGVWSVELMWPGGVVQRLVDGEVEVSREATK